MNVAAIGKRPAPVAVDPPVLGVAAKGTGRWSAHKIALWEPLCQALIPSWVFGATPSVFSLASSHRSARTPAVLSSGGGFATEVRMGDGGKFHHRGLTSRGATVPHLPQIFRPRLSATAV